MYPDKTVEGIVKSGYTMYNYYDDLNLELDLIQYVVLGMNSLTDYMHKICNAIWWRYSLKLISMFLLLTFGPRHDQFSESIDIAVSDIEKIVCYVTAN